MKGTPIDPQRGSVLIVVLWASVGLVSIALLFGHSMVMTYRGADNDFAGRQADQAIEGGIRYVESLFVNAETPGLFPDPTTYESEAVPVGEATFWILGRPDDPGNGTTREYGLVDEAGKLNLNLPQLTTDMLVQLPGMTDDLAANILDWRSTDSNGSGSGGINASVVKHGPFESIEELAMVSGATRTILFGEDANLNGVLDPNEDDGDRSPPADNSDGKLDAGILDYLTSFTREPNKRKDGTACIDIRPLGNDLWDYLREQLDQGRANQIRALFISQSPSAPPPRAPRSVLDFYVRSGMTEDEFNLVSDALTATDGDWRTGLINVNTATQAVLACVPGIGTDKAADVVSARLSRTQQDTSIAWIVPVLNGNSSGGTGPTPAGVAGQYITGQSWQVSADIAAVGRHGRGYRRTRVVIDMSTGTPRIIYRQNLAPLGWALGRDIRQDLALKKEMR